MCCFSGRVESVSDTSIFARPTGDGRQILAYGMSYAASAEVAMVLPLPAPPGSADDAVRFVNMERYAEFFGDLHTLFTEPPRSYDTLSARGEDSAVKPPPLPVHDVGSFEASFVPRPADFARLDVRFRLPADLWDKLPQYTDYGFAVFKLRGSGGGSVAAHPMAFSFPTRRPEAIYFPTVHVHDGNVHSTAHFDHSLYMQCAEIPKDFSAEILQPKATLSWRLPPWRRKFAETVDVRRASEVLLPERGAFFGRLRLEGEFENCDTWIGEGSHVPESTHEIEPD